MKDWNKNFLGEICREYGGSIQTGPFGSQLHQSDYTNEGVPVIMPKDIVDDKIDALTVSRIPVELANKLKKHRLELNDILFPRRGDIDKRVLIGQENVGTMCGTGCLKIQVPKEELYPKFLYYYLKQPSIVEWIIGQSIGATMENLNTSTLKKLEIKYPPLHTQQRIASILSAYDDLIEVNNQRIKLLEETARELYKEWFVRMRFPGWKETKFVKGVPEGWEVISLSDVVDFKMGQSPKSEFYNEVGEGLPFHQGVGTYGERFPEHRIFCSTEGRVAEKGDILFSVRAPVGRLNIADRKLIIGRGLSAMRHKKGLNSYLFYLLQNEFSKEDIIGNGSIFNSVGKDELKSFKILNVGRLAKRFNDLAGPIDEQLSVLLQQNTQLRQIRDRLLPRLISGKLSIKEP